MTSASYSCCVAHKMIVIIIKEISQVVLQFKTVSKVDIIDIS